MSQGVSSSQCQDFLFSFFEESQIDIFVRELQYNFFRHVILSLIHEISVCTQMIETITVCMYEQPVFRTGYSYVISTHQMGILYIIVGYEHIHIVKLSAFGLVNS